VGFWYEHNVHYPFLDNNYPKGLRDGWKYHSNFSRMGFCQKYAEYTSFVELLKVPMTGSARRKEKEEI
jgi:hypothetical protein